MSSVDIYTEIVLKTAAACGELKSFSAALTTEMQRWESTEITIDVTFRPPDLSAVRQRIRELQAEVVEIPYRFVQQGEAPRPPGSSFVQNSASATGRFGSNAAASGGSSIAMTNGRPGVDAQGFAVQAAIQQAAARTIDTTPIGESLESFRRTIDDTTSELFSLQRWFEQIASNSPPGWNRPGSGGGGNPPGGGGGGGGGGNNPPPTGGGLYDIEGDYEVRGERPRRPLTLDQELGALATAEEREAAELRTFLSNAGNGNGYNNLGLPAADGAGHRFGSRRGSWGEYLRNHPSLGQFVSAGGGVYALMHAMSSAVGGGNAMYGLSTSEANWQRDQAFLDFAEGMPLAGQVGNFISSSKNWALGRGFATDRRMAEYDIEQSRLADDVAKRGIGSWQTRELAKTYDPREAARIERQAEEARVQAELNDPKNNYRVTINTGRGGRKLGGLTAAGEKYLNDSRTAGAAREKRATDDYGRQHAADEGTAGINADAATREAQASESRASLDYSHDRELQDQLAEIDDEIMRKKEVLETFAKSPEYASKRKLYDAEAIAAQKQKLDLQIEMKRRWAAEDAEITANTNAANLQAVGKFFEATELLAKQAAENRIANEQDASRRILITLEYEAQRRQRLAEHNEETRQLQLQAERSGSDVSHRGIDQRKKDLNEEAMQAGFRDGLTAVDDKTGERGWLPRSSMSEGQKKRYDALIADRDNKIAMLEREQGLRSDTTAVAASDIRNRLAGNSYKADLDEIDRDYNADRENSQSPQQTEDAMRLRRQRIKSASRDHDDAVRDVRLTGKQAALRSQGFDRDADYEGTKDDIAKRLRGSLEDDSMRQATIDTTKLQLMEEQRRGMTSNTFGSMADYANAAMSSAMNDPSAALSEIAKLIAKLEQAGKETGDAQKAAAEAIIATLRPN